MPVRAAENPRVFLEFVAVSPPSATGARETQESAINTRVGISVTNTHAESVSKETDTKSERESVSYEPPTLCQPRRIVLLLEYTLAQHI